MRVKKKLFAIDLIAVVTLLFAAIPAYAGYKDSMNFYEYVGSQPTRFVDPYGLESGGTEKKCDSANGVTISMTIPSFGEVRWGNSGTSQMAPANSVTTSTPGSGWVTSTISGPGLGEVGWGNGSTSWMAPARSIKINTPGMNWATFRTFGR